MTKLITLLIAASFWLSVSAQTPEPYGPLPSARQLDWHKMEYYMFVHFIINTFTDLEWGLVDELSKVFNPSAVDLKHWSSIAKEAGMKGIILTVKHHDGFRLQPIGSTGLKNALEER